MLQRTWPCCSRRDRGWLIVIALLLALLPGLAAPPVACAQDGAWTVECVDCPQSFAYMTDRSLRLDAGGHPHIAYGENGLRYAWHDGTAWHYEVVDPAPWTGSYASLALDTDGQPHVAYQDSSNLDLKYASRSDSGWQVETVHSEGDVGYYASLDLDADGNPHISHAYAMGSVWYATRDEQGWHLENPGPGHEAGDTSLAVDAQGYPHIVFHNDDTDALQYLYKDAGGWNLSDLAGAAYTGASLSMALDAAGELHISYYDANGSALKYYHGGTATVVDSDPDTIWGHSSIALNAAGRPRITYRDEINGGLKFAHYDGSGWQTESLDPGPDAGYFSSLALDASGRARVSYMDGGALKYAAQDGYSWTIVVVDRAARTGGWSSLALDAADGAHIAYQESLSRDLLYAYKSSSGFEWLRTTVDETGSTGWLPSIDVDSSGQPYIGYSDATNSVVKVARPGARAGEWTIEEVAPHPQVTAYLSLAVDGEDRPHIVYRGLHGLEYAYRGASGWITETLGTEGLVGQFPHLALDGSGRAYVLYLDTTNWDSIFLKLAYKDGSTWHIVAVESLHMALGGLGLALDSNGVPHIAYLRSGPSGAPHALVYGHRQGNGWYLEVVDAEGTSPSLALDTRDRPRIAYGTKVAYGSAGGWRLQSLPEEVGLVRSLALDQHGRAHLTLGDTYALRYATGVPYRVHLPLVIGH